MFAGMGRERARVLAVRSVDPVMSVMGAVGLAASARSALVIDFRDELGRVPGRSLVDLIIEGPRLDELSPGRTGVAILNVGPAEIGDAHSVVERLSLHWPAVVVREPPKGWPGAVVPVRPLYPGCLFPAGGGPSVWQSLGWGSRPPGPGPVLPPLKSRQVRRVLTGGLPANGRWVKVWERVWGLPWA